MQSRWRIKTSNTKENRVQYFSASCYTYSFMVCCLARVCHYIELVWQMDLNWQFRKNQDSSKLGAWPTGSLTNQKTVSCWYWVLKLSPNWSLLGSSKCTWTTPSLVGMWLQTLVRLKYQLPLNRAVCRHCCLWSWPSRLSSNLFTNRLQWKVIKCFLYKETKDEFLSLSIFL